MSVIRVTRVMATKGSGAGDSAASPFSAEERGSRPAETRTASSC
jgi:hypothetical protein